jgi:DNA primase
LNVEELLLAKEIPYTPKGGDFEIRCLSPDHPDRHPSLRVDKVTGIFNCFSCGFKGNLFYHFEEKANKLQQRRELLKQTINKKRAETIGLEIPIHSVAYKGEWRDIKCSTYTKFEAFQNHSSEYVGRIVFPIRNITGKIVAFNGRHTTGGTPKYLFSPHGVKLPLFPKVTPIKGAIILVEGIFDMLNLHDKGLTNAVCCFGTNNVNEDKLSMLRMQGVDTIDVFFDGDTAGEQGADKVKSMCAHVDMVNRNIHLEGVDPGDLSQEDVDNLKRKLYQ